MCRWIPSLGAIVIAALALWPNLIGISASKWVIVIIALLLLVHPYCCRSCGCEGCDCCSVEEMQKPKKRKK